jgi:hypothetical protein
VKCLPNVDWLRPASYVLPDASASWVLGRKTKILPELRHYLSTLRLADVDIDCYMAAMEKDHSLIPTVGVATSGGA